MKVVPSDGGLDIKHAVLVMDYDTYLCQGQLQIILWPGRDVVLIK